MSNPINVYERPAPDPHTQKLPLAYMVAVMQAAAQGAPVQCTYREYSAWSLIEIPDWNWVLRDYRIDPASRPAPQPTQPEHNNPFKVDDWVVGVDMPERRIYHALKTAHRVTKADDSVNPSVFVEGHEIGWGTKHLRHATLSEIEQACGTIASQAQPKLTYFDIGGAVIQTDGSRYTRVCTPCAFLTSADIRGLLLEHARKEGYILGARGVCHPIPPTGLGNPGAADPIVSIYTWLPGDPWFLDARTWVSQKVSEGKPFVYVVTQSGAHAPIERFNLVPPVVLKRVPLTPADLTGGSLWLKAHEGDKVERAILAFYPGGDILVAGWAKTINFEHAMASQYQWSSDRVNWKPFYKEV